MRRWLKHGITLLSVLVLLSGCFLDVEPTIPPTMDHDGNKIFDDLDQLLGRVSDGEKVPVLVLMNEQTDLYRMTDAGNDIQIKRHYGVVPAVAASLTKSEIEKLAGLAFVRHIEYDAPVRVMMGTASQWFGVSKARQDFGVTGDRDGAGYSGEDIVVAVIDTGIDPNHVDLDGGKVIAWKDWVQNRSTPYDDNGHGSHVAGIIAGTGEGNGLFQGVAPGASLIGLKVLDSNGFGSLSNVTAAVDWAVANKAAYNIRIISMSLGTSSSSDGTDTLSLAVNRAADEGIIPVIAAGNSGPGRNSIGSPGAATNAITVGAMADVGEKGFGLANFSSRGPTRDDRIKPDISAPGVNISAPKANSGNGYVAFSGTSMATPFVSGTIALMLDANPNLNIAQVKALLQGTAQDWGPAGQDIDYGAGRLDGYRAIAAAGGFPVDAAPPVPGHLVFAGSIGSGATVDHYFTLTDVNYPVNLTLLMSGSGTNPDLDLFLFGPSGQEVGRATSTNRQDQLAVMVAQTGTYRIQIRAYSGTGDYVVDLSAGTAGPADLAPAVAIDAPAEGATVSGQVPVLIRATDDHQVARVEAAVDGGAYHDITPSYDGSFYRYLWNTTGIPDGLHTIGVRAVDSIGQAAHDLVQVTVQNGPPPGQQEVNRIGTVSASSRTAEFPLRVAQPGFVDYTLAWDTTADLDLYVFAPDGSLAGRGYTLNNPERLRVDTARWGTGEYRVRADLYSGVTSAFALTAAGYQRLSYSDTVSPSVRNVTHPQRFEYAGQSRVVLSWPSSSDLDFFVYDPTGRERARGFTLNNPEMREFPVDLVGEWSLRVSLFSGPGTGYTATWFIPAAILS